MKINEINNLLELFYYQYQKQSKKNIFLESLKEPKKKYSWEDVYSNVIKLSKEISKNIKKSDRCLLISENRPEWLISDLAIMLSEGITVPAYTTYTERDYEYIIDDCTPAIIIVSDNAQYKKVKNIIPKKSFIKKVIFFESIDHNSSDYELHLNDILKDKEYEEKNFLDLKIERKSAACIIYTSGTQGNPKGVILSHGGILNNCEGSYNLLKSIISNKTKFLTWLPLSHSYEHTVQFVQILIGAEIFYAESLEKLLTNMSVAKPTIMTAVPRFYQNLYNKININFNNQKGLKKKIIDLTIELGIKKLKKTKLSIPEKIIDFICEKLVRKKVKNQFGGNLQAFVSGGGALDKKIGEFLNSIGLPTLQGYGLTEASPVVSCNVPDKIQVETVGPPFRTNLVRIAHDGEILIKGENVMIGYWNKQKETDEIIKNGWLHTGDIGEINNEGNLKITDRKKELIVNLGGDNISPTKIENLLCLNENIKQSFVYGDKKNYLVAIIVAEKNCNELKIKEFIENNNKNLSLIEKIKKFIIVFDEFTIENRMLTPTLKLKRKVILENYKKRLENLYNIN